MTSRPEKIVERQWSERERVLWKGARNKALGDLYHAWLQASWTQSLIGIVVVYLTANALFGLGYWLIGGIENARAGSFEDAFFFSVQTLATIGYGKMVPLTREANVLVGVEALCGIIGTAIVTGLVFAKFARPTARVLFSKVMTVVPHEGVPSLQFRMANERQNRIVEAQLRAALLRYELTKEGNRIRRILDLQLVRDRTLTFALTWTAIHLLDEKSPLRGLTDEALAQGNLEIIVTLQGLDETFSQTISARHHYLHTDILFGRRFVDIMNQLPDGRTEIDLPSFHETRPDGAGPAAPQTQAKEAAKASAS